ncbi:MAG: hypothetical protein EA426_10395 [Spirochaetaceae bacterium]|nr:MAG: hypothetical protein EA426_10395 [Spirochaetaceae bacterium]
MIVYAEEIIKRFNGKLALDCFSLTVEKGEVIGLTPVDDGRITVFGRTQNGRNKQTKKRIGYVTQELTAYEEMKARDNLTGSIEFSRFRPCFPGPFCTSGSARVPRSWRKPTRCGRSSTDKRRRS